MLYNCMHCTIVYVYVYEICFAMLHGKLAVVGLELRAKEKPEHTKRYQRGCADDIMRITSVMRMFLGKARVKFST